MKGLVEEKDKTLEEMAEQLFDAKVQMDTLRENDSSAVADRSPGGQWLEDSDVRSCQICDKEFNISRRKVSYIFCITPSTNLVSRVRCIEILYDHLFVIHCNHQIIA